jgi:hypothetical protein
MEAALKALSGSGATGAVLAVAFALLAGVGGILGWALKRFVDAAIEQQKAAIKQQDAALRHQEKFGDFIEALTKSLNAIGVNCMACRSDSVSSLRDVEATVKSEVAHVVWASHDKAALETAAAIGRAVETLEASFTGAANSIRASNAQLLVDVENKRLRAQVEDLSRPTNVTPNPSGVVR